MTEALERIIDLNNDFVGNPSRQEQYNARDRNPRLDDYLTYEKPLRGMDFTNNQQNLPLPHLPQQNNQFMGYQSTQYRHVDMNANMYSEPTPLVPPQFTPQMVDNIQQQNFTIQPLNPIKPIGISNPIKPISNDCFIVKHPIFEGSGLPKPLHETFNIDRSNNLYDGHTTMNYSKTYKFKHYYEK